VYLECISSVSRVCISSVSRVYLECISPYATHNATFEEKVGEGWRRLRRRGTLILYVVCWHMLARSSSEPQDRASTPTVSVCLQGTMVRKRHTQVIEPHTSPNGGKWRMENHVVCVEWIRNMGHAKGSTGVRCERCAWARYGLEAHTGHRATYFTEWWKVENGQPCGVRRMDSEHGPCQRVHRSVRCERCAWARYRLRPG